MTRPILLVVLFLWSMAPAAAAEKLDSVAGRLRSDSRLQGNVTLSARDRPMSELLAEIGRSSGVSLRAGLNTADDKVTLFVRERPAADVLLLLARHFEFRWYRHRDGYELSQDGAAKQREARLRAGADAEQLRSLHARMALCANLAEIPRDRLEARRRELVEALKAEEITPEERAAAREETAAISDLLRPGALPALTLYRMLNQGHVAELRAGRELRFSTDSGTLSPVLAQQIHQAAAEMMKGGQVRVLGGPGAAPDPGNPGPPAGASASVSLGGDQPRPFIRGQDRAPLRLQFRFTSLRGEGAGRRMLPVMWSPSPLVPEPPRTGEVETSDPELNREVELPRLPEQPVAPALPTPERPPAGMIPLSQALELLHRATGMDVLSDSFVRARVPEAALRGKKRIAQLLGDMTGRLDYAWEKDDDTLLLRNQLFYLDRPEEIPERTLRPWRQHLARTGGFSLDDLGAVAAKLKDPHLRSLERYWDWYLESPAVAVPERPPGLFANRYHLRFWAALSPGQRQAAREEVLPVSRMTPAQRGAFATALASPRSGLFVPGNELAASPTPADIAAGGFTLQSREIVRHDFTGTSPSGGRVMVRTLNAPDSGGAPRIPMLGDPNVHLEIASTTVMDSHNFHYHLAGSPRPARTASVQVPRPKPKPGR